MAKLPRWGDDEALLAWIGPLIPEPFQDWLVVPPHVWNAPFTGLDRESEAIEAARQGNFKLLGYLMDPRQSVYRPQRLSPKSEALIAARLQGESKAKRGKPKQTEARRRLSNPVHAAADEVAIIENILRQHYPKQRGIRERAIDIAAARANISRERLAEHLKSKHRLPRAQDLNAI